MDVTVDWLPTTTNPWTHADAPGEHARIEMPPAGRNTLFRESDADGDKLLTSNEECTNQADERHSHAEDFWARFLSIVHPGDKPIPAAWKRYYCTLFELARELRPARLCEIGVRAGYSAFAMLCACPTAAMLGIEVDIDDGTSKGHWGCSALSLHAESILTPFNHRLLIADSHDLRRLPRSDLIYVDGDHTRDGCLADLRLAARSTDTGLVDDYDSFSTVREACERFIDESPGFSSRYIPNGLTGLLLLRRIPTLECMRPPAAQNG